MSAQRRKSTRIYKSPIGWTVAVALVLALALGFGGAWFNLRGHGPEPSAAVSRPTKASHAGHTRPQPHSAPKLETERAASLFSGHVRVCGNKTLLGGGPTSPPAGAIRVGAGSNAHVDFGQANTTYWFAPGVHTLGSGRYTQIRPGSGATFVGAPGAILDGRHDNYYAFADSASNVTISYLTIQHFGTWGGNFDQGVVNIDSAPGWTIDHTTIRNNAGAGVMLGSSDTLSYDCLANNQQYGFNAYSPSGPAGLVLDHNDISGNNTYNWEARKSGCGCTGGGKFWDVRGAVITNNWVHHNHSVGMWADTNNRGFDIEDNYFESNYDVGLFYEISYNALIKHNLFVRNAITEGTKNSGFPTPALYISESGSDSRVPGKYGTNLQITGNLFINNWSGVVLWENANRFCGSPDNSSTGDCTIVAPHVASTKTCNKAHLYQTARTAVPDYYDLCRWKTQNVSLTDNLFRFEPSKIGPTCTAARGCGYNGIFSEWGSDPSWSPYKGRSVEYHITFGQHNHFSANTYQGPWRFMALEQNQNVSWQTWREQYHQDMNSTLQATFP
ncbi:MAG TPA: right-handed parallel beta-helix repeat-containing protein [Streptosporangiaceae bacterium]|nr:right-handed parallel beta-helix repeat-containing protein [Streptosporangiaceae bacterium]